MGQNPNPAMRELIRMNSLTQQAQMSIASKPETRTTAKAETSTPTLRDLLEDGIYLLFLLRSDNAPISASEFNSRIDQYLATFDRVCKTFNKPFEDVLESKYAFCALLDEIILSSKLPIRDEWEQSPLQLRLFGEHLAGEIFFDKLEALRTDPQRNIETLEIFHTCLLLGFQGKYLLEGSEKLNYLTARLNQEIMSIRGPSKGFSPNWRIPLKFNEYIRHELPLWLYYALVGIAIIGVFVGFQWLLTQQMKSFPLPQSLTPSVQLQQDSTPPTEQPAEKYTPPKASQTAANAPAYEDSQLAKDAKAELNREAEYKARQIKDQTISNTRSAVRSLYR